MWRCNPLIAKKIKLKLLTLRWRSVDAHYRDIPTVIGCPIILHDRHNVIIDSQYVFTIQFGAGTVAGDRNLIWLADDTTALTAPSAPLFTSSVRSMMWFLRILVLSASKLWHSNPSTHFGHIEPDFLTFRFPARFPRFAWRTICNFQNLDHVQQVWADSYAVNCMNQCWLTAVIDPSSDCALTAHPMTRVISLNQILLVYFVSILGLAFYCHCNWQVHLIFAGRLSTRFRV